jgi:hypothetical protein
MEIALRRRGLGTPLDQRRLAILEVLSEQVLARSSSGLENYADTLSRL